jgi:hypothetical protein
VNGSAHLAFAIGAAHRRADPRMACVQTTQESKPGAVLLERRADPDERVLIPCDFIHHFVEQRWHLRAKRFEAIRERSVVDVPVSAEQDLVYEAARVGGAIAEQIAGEDPFASERLNTTL